MNHLEYDHEMVSTAQKQTIIPSALNTTPCFNSPATITVKSTAPLNSRSTRVTSAVIHRRLSPKSSIRVSTDQSVIGMWVKSRQMADKRGEVAGLNVERVAEIQCGLQSV